MKKVTKAVLSGLAKASVGVTKMNVNSTCMFLTYQPTVPASAKKLSKFQLNENESK